MPGVKRKGCFFDEEEAVKIEESLRAMVADMSFNTVSSYNTNEELYPDNVISFVEKHMTYLRTHSGINPQHYLSNLRLMTRKR